jgi:beta-lactamase regulating signal transducer with metallopeptidase domain
MNLGELFPGTGGLESAVVRTALVLMHSLWQVLLVVNVVAILLAVLGRATPNVRYTVALVGLLMLPAFPLVTWFVVEPTRQPDVASATASVAEFESKLLRSTPPLSETTFEKFTRLAGGIDRYCRQHAAWLAAAWGIGVAAFALRFLAAWLAVWKLHRTTSDDIPHSVNETLHRLLKSMGMSPSIRLSATDRVDGPAVVGWLRPLILLPAQMLTGLSSDDLTHILAHELAHIRRHDYAVNLVQCVIEMLFFHHPAVWWLSHQVREEREHCCDEIAIAACGDRFAYARSLATLDDMRPEPRPLVLALGTRGGRLMNRIRRLLGVPTPSVGGSGAIVLAGMALVVLVALALGVNDATAQTKEKPGEPKAEEGAAKVFAAELDAIGLIETERLVQQQQAQEQVKRAEQLARVQADLDKAVAELQLREKKFQMAELELALEEANAMDTFANEEMDVYQKLMEAGQTSQKEYMQRKQNLIATRLAKQKAALALDAIKTGKDVSRNANELELENATLALRAAEEGLQLVEKQIDAGQASAGERATARREAIKAKFQLDRLRLRQQQLQQSATEQPAETQKQAAFAQVIDANQAVSAAEVRSVHEALARVVAANSQKGPPADPEQPVVKSYPLKRVRATTALDMIKKRIDPKGTQAIQAGADDRSHTVIVVALQDLHKQIAQLIAELEGTDKAKETVSDKAEAVRSAKKKIEDYRDVREAHIDEYRKAKQKEQEVATSEIDPTALILRLSLEIRGHSPTPGEIKEFVHDKEPGAVLRLTKRFLDGAEDRARQGQGWKVKKDAIERPVTPKSTTPKAEDAKAATSEQGAAKSQLLIEIRLLELDVRKAENDFSVAAEAMKRTDQLNEKNATAYPEVVKARMEAFDSQIALERAKLKLEAAKLKLPPDEGAKDPNVQGDARKY